MVDDRWFSRDLPVLKTIVEIHDRTGRGNIRATTVVTESGFDADAVVRAVRALHLGHYLKGGTGSAQQEFLFVGVPTGDALRAVGAWPTPEGQLDRLIAALADAADDEDRGVEERNKLKQVVTGLRGAAYQIAIAALGGAGGNLISG
jgi:hypothetical protein